MIVNIVLFCFISAEFVNRLSPCCISWEQRQTFLAHSKEDHAETPRSAQQVVELATSAAAPSVVTSPLAERRRSSVVLREKPEIQETVGRSLQTRPGLTAEQKR